MQRPRPIVPGDSIEDFDCGNEDLNQWLLTRAVANEASGASRTYIIADAQKVIGYYALMAGSIANATAPGNVRRNMPDPIPVAILGRLAVATSHQNDGLGTELLHDAIKRTLWAADTLGIRALLIHAASERARTFYEHHGFQRSAVDDMTLMATLQTLRNTFG